MSKTGPKGPSKLKGGVADVILREHEKDPSRSSAWLSGKVFAETRIRISERSVRYFLEREKRGR
jgi:hypothetical protein